MGLNLRRSKDEEFKIQKPVEKKTEKELNLNFKTVCITGTIPGMTRYGAKTALIIKYPNIKFHDAILMSTDYLITGHGVGQTKLKAAKSKGVTIIEASTIFK